MKPKFVFSQFYVFMKLRLNFQMTIFISHFILWENLNETKKWYNIEKEEEVAYRCHKVILNSKAKAFLILCEFLIWYQVLHSVNCKYDYLPHKNPGLKYK